ncbi:MAG: nucleotidyltransferase family protein, partial [Firmicutes bacterium]|nr:nucleotidyltransferase family protein [Bacillota bacterium]
MTKVLGIIAEYDPFHNGHAYMLKEAVNCVSDVYDCAPDDVIRIAAISGDFTQRGEPALIDKWSRAEMAIRQGFDLVVGMPVVFCCNNAGYFARAGVEILESLGAEVIAFGSETTHLQTLLNAAGRRASITDEQQEMIKSLVKEGKSYPAALSAVLGEEVQFGPNDSLGIEYIRHMKKAAPIPIKRRGAEHDSGEAAGTIASASFIRRRLLDGEPLEAVSELIPSTTMDVLKRESEAHGFCSPDMLFKLIAAKAASSSDEELNAVYGAEEGLGSKLKDEFRYATGWDGLLWALKSKRYTMTRVQRVLIHMLTGLTKDMVHEAKPYVRILAFNARGAAHLKSLKKSDALTLPLVENIKTDLKEHPELRSTFE